MPTWEQCVNERVAILDALTRHEEGLSVSQLVGVLGASDSQIRRGLSVLVAAGAVATVKDDPSGPGRPTLRFRLAGRASGWPELVEMLLALLGRVESVNELMTLEVGREHGAAMAAGAPPDAIDAEMARLGFAPRDISSSRDRRDDAQRLRFDTCPFRDAVSSDGGHAVCLLHQGLLEGLSAKLGGYVDQFEVRDPTVAGCQVRVRFTRPG